ncbi:hypothetical protein SH584_05760 [Sphingomonas sp. LY29]|uniref:hypothetical protein n=1 Tax=Sphingomonas sp. LY29 TaxID=3095341 RepID=UPI002D79FD44|nr:hypothetical protein [Sphingomonas sp. LY29]WRP26927.1 hypothetical protein SH584_05760 [Sphingomonas sp. LY29]
MKAFALAAAVAALCVPVTSVSAQEVKAERMTDVTWHSIEMVKFHSGKRERAMEIVEKYFAAADRDLGGGGVIDLHMQTGPWDAVVVFPMRGGPGDMSWATSPDEVRWMNALAKRAGGPAQAKALLAEWDSLVARSENHVAHRHPKW